MAPTPSNAAHVIERAARLIDVGRGQEAQALLEPVLRLNPTFADGLHLLAACRLQAGAAVEAEQIVRRAIALNPQAGMYRYTLGEILMQLGWPELAVEAFRKALEWRGDFKPAARQLARALLQDRRPAEALAALEPFHPSQERTDLAMLDVYALVLKALERPEEAIVIYRLGVDAAPASHVAEHNLAAALGDLGRYADAEAGAVRAIAKGSAAAETRLVLARALLGLGRLDEAEKTFRDAIKMQPRDPSAHRDWAQLVWMRTGDKAHTLSLLESSGSEGENAPELIMLKSDLLSAMGDVAAANSVLTAALGRYGDHGGVVLAAARAAIGIGDHGLGLQRAERLCALLPPNEPIGVIVRCEAFLALGRADEAAALATDLTVRFPQAQQPQAYLAAAWRLADDQRYKALYDYDALVRSAYIETPQGWTHLADYLADLLDELKRLHHFRTHPVGQSVLWGGQVSNVLRSPTPALQAFKGAAEGPIRAYLEGLGHGTDPMRRRNGQGFSYRGDWSVRLGPGGGRHVDHIHPEGWISSACYIEVPDSVRQSAVEGRLRFGKPGISTTPELAADRLVCPEPGMLVLFPSFFWHGTEPFSGPQERMTLAFDLVPAVGAANP